MMPWEIILWMITLQCMHAVSIRPMQVGSMIAPQRAALRPPKIPSRPVTQTRAIGLGLLGRWLESQMVPPKPIDPDYLKSYRFTPNHEPQLLSDSTDLQHQALVHAFLTPQSPESNDLIQKWGHWASKKLPFAIEELQNARTEAGFRLALINPKAPTSTKFMRERQLYLRSQKRMDEAIKEWKSYQDALFVSQKEKRFQRDLARPLDQESVVSVDLYLFEMKQKQVNQRYAQSIQDRFQTARLNFAVYHPLDPRADQAVREWISFQRQFHPESSKSIIAHVISDFEERKLHFLQNLDRFTADISFPVRIQLTDHTYHLSELLGHGSSGIVFGGHIQGQANPVSIKILHQHGMHDMEQFRNEIHALKRLRLLVSYDERHMIIVSKRIHGVSYEDILLHETNKEKLKSYQAQYDQLGFEFYKSTSLLHGSIKPSNVLVDSSGKLHLIDFGRAHGPKSLNDQSIMKELLDDYYDGQRRLGFTLSQHAATRAFHHPKESGSREAILHYIHMLKSQGDWDMAMEWEGAFKQLYRQ